MKSIKIERVLKKIGLDLKNARRRRLVSEQDMAERLDISRQTLSKMERGEAGVSMEKYLTAFMLFDKIDDFEKILDEDKTGTSIMEERVLPKRIRSRK